MPEIPISFARPWAIRQPSLTRYIEEEWVDDFLKNGNLGLSSFKAFRAHPDEFQGDKHEGGINMEIKTPSGTHRHVGRNVQKAFVLCTSTVEGLDSAASFDSSYGFRINNSTAFANAISRQIPGFIGGAEGLCCYSQSDSIDISIPDFIRSPVHSDKSGKCLDQEFEDYDKRISTYLRESFFRKHISYADQHEYRFVWFTNGFEQDYLDICSQEAVQFCEKIAV